MEKQVPHCKLSVVKALVGTGRCRMTQVALAGAASLGFDDTDILQVIMALSAADFHKSMTTHRDHRVWQDVYRPVTTAGAVYLKLTVVDDLLVVSFKEL